MARQDEDQNPEEQYQEELNEENLYEEESCPSYPEEPYLYYPGYYPGQEPPGKGRVPGLDFRFLHCFGMAVVAVAILGSVSSMNGGYRGGKASDSGAFTVQTSGVGSAEPPSNAQALKSEAEAARVAHAIRYLNTMTAAYQDADGALAQMQTMMNEYDGSPEIRKDIPWQSRTSTSLLIADSAGSRLLALSNPPSELAPLNHSLRLAGRELRLSVRNFAQAIGTGNSMYMSTAGEHHRNCRRMADEATAGFKEYREKLGY